MHYVPRSEQLLGERKYEAIEAILKDISLTSSEMIMHSLSGVLRDRDVVDLLKHGMLPYIYAAGFLSFAGREINEENLAKAISSLGMKPNNRIVTLFLESRVRSHLVYIYSFYFLLANGERATKERIMHVVESLDMKVDHAAMDQVIEFLKRDSRFTRI
jgi:ribosomal protein L12E/L44/L45/RPP1/RPP2